jgi:hypothetical protein
MARPADRRNLQLTSVSELTPRNDRRTSNYHGLLAPLRRPYRRDVPHLPIGPLMIEWEPK